MADDCANNWGIQLCLPDQHNRSVKAPVLPRVLALGEQETFTALSSLVSAETKLFVFERVACSGSQANSWAIDDATMHNASLCLFGAGSFIAGDGSAMQSCTSSTFHLGDDLAMVSETNDVKSILGRRNTVPLPCHIPGEMASAELKKHEDDCLQAIHIKMCVAKMNRSPCKALLVELMLAGNGASLSNRALMSIGKPCCCHGVDVIVDETVTGGRTGSMLHLLSKPGSFQAAVTHVTLGKWCKMGTVILSRDWHKKRAVLHPAEMRGASTGIGAKEATMCWRCVKKCTSEMEEKRVRTLRKLRLNDSDVWGKGILLCGPCRRETPCGLKCRCLPLVHANTPFDSVKSKTPKQPHKCRAEVNQKIVDTQRMWILEVPVLDGGRCWDDKHRKERLLDFQLCSNLIECHSDLEENPSEIWRELCLPQGTNRTEGEGTLARLRTAGCIENTQFGRKRQREWKLVSGFIAPWKSSDMDQVLETLLQLVDVAL